MILPITNGLMWSLVRVQTYGMLFVSKLIFTRGWKVVYPHHFEVNPHITTLFTVDVNFSKSYFILSASQWRFSKPSLALCFASGYKSSTAFYTVKGRNRWDLLKLMSTVKSIEMGWGITSKKWRFTKCPP